MRSSTKQLSLFLVGFLLIGQMTACNTSKKLAAEETPTEVVPAPPSEKPEFYLSQRLNYQTFSGKGNLQIITPKENRKLNFTLAMNKDKDLLASIRAAGLLEVARAYATKDSLFALNRLDKSAYALGYQQGTQLLQANVPFSALQRMFSGAPLLDETAKLKGMRVNGQQVIITQIEDQFTQILTYNRQKGTLEKLELNNETQGFSCTILYSDYNKIGLAAGELFAYKREITLLNKGEKMSANFSFNQATINYPINTNFQIPGSYNIISKLKK